MALPETSRADRYLEIGDADDKAAAAVGAGVLDRVQRHNLSCIWRDRLSILYLSNPPRPLHYSPSRAAKGSGRERNTVHPAEGLTPVTPLAEGADGERGAVVTAPPTTRGLRRLRGEPLGNGAPCTATPSTLVRDGASTSSCSPMPGAEAEVAGTLAIAKLQPAAPALSITWT